MVIYRKITADSTSEWRINNKAAIERDVQALVLDAQLLAGGVVLDATG